MWTETTGMKQEQIETVLYLQNAGVNYCMEAETSFSYTRVLR